MNLLRIYDIDGTITKPGNDLWYLTTRSLSSNPSLFDNYVELWKNSMKNGASPYEASKLMMQKGIECMGKNSNPSRIKQRAREVCEEIIQNNQYYSAAITHICTSIDANFQIVFSTTNYREGAEAFVEILVESALLKDYHQEQIITSGTIVDWQMGAVTHFNMGEDKNIGISKALNIPIDQLSNQTNAVYGDDPKGNDVGILSLSSKAFVIANPKNSEVPIPANMIRTSWEDILENYF
ncbi:MAG: hypothetical protein F6K26_21815 [Moorea sp. SIO2I5]|nr:hypothetical protein [Moorena sp. SIO2I5]